MKRIRGSYDKAAIVKAAKNQPDWVYKQCPVCRWGIHTTEATLTCGRCGVEMVDLKLQKENGGKQ